MHRGGLAYFSLYMVQTGRSGSDGDGHRWHGCMRERGRGRVTLIMRKECERRQTNNAGPLHVPGGQRSALGSIHSMHPEKGIRFMPTLTCCRVYSGSSIVTYTISLHMLVGTVFGHH